MNTKKRQNGLPHGAVSALSNAAYWMREIEKGLHDDHHVSPAQPLPAAQRRDAEVIQRAVARLVAFDRKARGIE